METRRGGRRREEASICSIIPTGLGERGAEDKGDRGTGDGGMEGRSLGRSVPKARDRKPTIDYQACYYDERRFFRG